MGRGAGGLPQVVRVCLTSKCEALCSNPNSAKQTKQKQQNKMWRAIRGQSQCPRGQIWRTELDPEVGAMLGAHGKAYSEEVWAGARGCLSADLRVG
jgi:hypothetical protein